MQANLMSTMIPACKSTSEAVLLDGIYFHVLEIYTRKLWVYLNTNDKLNKDMRIGVDPSRFPLFGGIQSDFS